MLEKYYDAIFKRRSFHTFRGVGETKISHEELKGIENAYKEFETLYPDIKTGIRIVPCDGKGSIKKDAEYCILIYSEKKDNYMMNVGYIGQQLDLYLTQNNIGSLWYGLGKPDQDEYRGFSFVIMIAIHKVDNESLFRRNMYKEKRKPLKEIWKGEELPVANVARFAPSAVNSQPWYVENADGKLTVYRYKKPGRMGLISPASLLYFNRIDIGIYLCILETCLEHEGIEIKRELFIDEGGNEQLTKVAEYSLN